MRERERYWYVKLSSKLCHRIHRLSVYGSQLTRFVCHGVVCVFVLYTVHIHRENPPMKMQAKPKPNQKTQKIQDGEIYGRSLFCGLNTIRI